jgi:hypothetical protein
VGEQERPLVGPGEMNGGRGGGDPARIGSGIRGRIGLQADVGIEEVAAGGLEPEGDPRLGQSGGAKEPGTLIEVDEAGVTDGIPAGDGGEGAGGDQERQRQERAAEEWKFRASH